MITKIIVEGPNNVGKSSLIKMLHDKLGWEVEHCTNDTPMDEYSLFKSLSEKTPMIFDRHGIGEMVYPEIYGRKSQIERRDLRRLYEYFDKDVLIIFVFADMDFVVKAHASKHEEFNLQFVCSEVHKFRREFDYFEEYCHNIMKFKHTWGKGYIHEIEQIIERIYQ